MKKRVVSLVFCFLLILQLCVGVFPAAAERISGDYQYYLSSGNDPYTMNAVIQKYTGSADTVVIPSVLDGHTVTGISGKAFADHTQLTRVEIPETVLWVAGKAFDGCTSLSTIILPDTAVSIDTDAFVNTAYYNDGNNWDDHMLYIGTHLVAAEAGLSGAVSIREGTTVVAPDVFSKQTELVSVTMPDSVWHVGSSAFYECTSLQQVQLSENLTSLGGYAFYGCSALTRIELPDGVKSIGTETFYGCSALETVELGAHVSELGIAAFYKCTSLKTINYPESLTTIGTWCFQYCSSLNDVSIPQNVTSLSYKAFEDTAYYNDPSNWKDGSLYIDNVLVEVKPQVGGDYVIDDGTRMLAYNAFRYCEEITSISIPDSVRVIGISAFEGCKKLRHLTVPESVREINFAMCRECTALESVSIPEHITEIPGYAFLDCVSLKEFTFSKNVKKIGIGAFRNCDSLRLVFIPKNVKGIEGQAFLNCDSLVHVLYGGSQAAWFDGVSSYAFDENMAVHRGTDRTLVIETEQFMFCKKCQTTILGQKSHKLFSDVHFGAWYHANGAVDYAYNTGLFKGTSVTTFEPNTPVTRGMFVTVLGRLHGVKDERKQTPFADVKRSAYFSGYVAWAAESGVVKGSTPTTFEPDAAVTREQICAMLYRYCDHADVKLKKLNKETTFTDAGEISAYAVAAVKGCQTGGIVSGKGGGRFDPCGNATRAEVATILMNFCENYK